MKAPRRVVVGRIVGTHGLRGSVQVKIFGGTPDHLLNAEKVMLGSGADDADAVTLVVVAADPGRPAQIRMTLAGIEDRDAASELRGRLVMLDTDELEGLESGEYYEYQLVGCRVEGEDGMALGTVREIWPTGASDVLVVESEGGRRHLIPTGGEFLRNIDLDEGRIVVSLIPGLLDPS